MTAAKTFKTCSLAGCDGNADWKAGGGKGYCSAHYTRLKRHGDPLGGGETRGYVPQFITDKVLSCTSDDCLIWPFGRGADGRGRVNVDGRMVLAHRYVCELAHGAAPSPSHHAAHSCGKGDDGCVNPTHLRWATKVENEADKLIHGTHNRGERQGGSKLTEHQAREVIRLKGVVTQRELADRFGVSEGAIAGIHAGRNWAWLSAA